MMEKKELDILKDEVTLNDMEKNQEMGNASGGAYTDDSPRRGIQFEYYCYRCQHTEWVAAIDRLWDKKCPICRQEMRGTGNAR